MNQQFRERQQKMAVNIFKRNGDFFQPGISLDLSAGDLFGLPAAAAARAESSAAGGEPAVFCVGHAGVSGAAGAGDLAQLFCGAGAGIAAGGREDGPCPPRSGADRPC